MESEGQKIRDAYQEAEGEALAESSSRRAYAKASALRDVLDDLVGTAAELRAEMAYRLMNEEGLSVSQLAERLGVSKARAGQLAVAGRRSHESRVSGEGSPEQRT